MFYPSTCLTYRKYNLHVHSQKTIKFGKKSLKIIYPILRSAVNPNKTGIFEGSFPLTRSYFKKNLLISPNI